MDNMPRGEKTKELWQNPEYRKRMSQIHKGKKFSIETRKKMSLTHKKEYMTNPIHKKNLLNFGKKHGMWKGDEVKYGALHAWIRRYKPKPEVCEICNQKEPKEVANISGKYRRDFNDFQWLCIKCHKIKDGTINNLTWNQNIVIY